MSNESAGSNVPVRHASCWDQMRDRIPGWDAGRGAPGADKAAEDLAAPPNVPWLGCQSRHLFGLQCSGPSSRSAPPQTQPRTGGRRRPEQPLHRSPESA